MLRRTRCLRVLRSTSPLCGTGFLAIFVSKRCLLTWDPLSVGFRHVLYSSVWDADVETCFGCSARKPTEKLISGAQMHACFHEVYNSYLKHFIGARGHQYYS